MNKMTPKNIAMSADALRRSELYGTLDSICENIEISDARLEAARESYEAATKWISGSEHVELQLIDMYVHGSMGLADSTRWLPKSSDCWFAKCAGAACVTRTRDPIITNRALISLNNLDVAGNSRLCRKIVPIDL